MLNLPVGQKRLTNVAQVKYKVGKETFTLACYRNKVIAWRLGQEQDISEVLQIEDIFTNVNRGEVANDASLNKAFKGMSKDDRIKSILNNGVLQVTDDERDALNEECFKQVSQFVADRVLEASTGTRMPIETIQDELRAIGFSVQWTSNPKRQGLRAIKELEAPRSGATYIVRSWFLAEIVVGQGVSATEVISDLSSTFNQKLREIEKESLLNTITTNTDDTSITFNLHPSEYGRVAGLVQKYLPLSKIDIIKSDINPLIYKKSMNDNIVLSTPAIPDITALFTSNMNLFPETNGLAAGSSGNDDNTDVEKRTCHVCVEVDQKNATFTGEKMLFLHRKHMKSEWHNFNMSRINAEAEPVELDLFEVILEELADVSSDN